jgi:hypothetical protein
MMDILGVRSPPLACIVATVAGVLSLYPVRSHAQAALDAKGDITFGSEDASIAIISYVSLGCPACETWIEIFHAPVIQHLEGHPNLKHVIKLIAERSNPAEVVEEENEAFAAAVTSCDDLGNAHKMQFVQFWLRTRNEWLRNKDQITAMAQFGGPGSRTWIECAAGRIPDILAHELDLQALGVNAFPVSVVGPVVEGDKMIVADHALSATEEGAAHLLNLIRGLGRDGGIDERFPQLLDSYRAATGN